jgi:hypothetical protein
MCMNLFSMNAKHCCQTKYHLLWGAKLCLCIVCSDLMCLFVEHMGSKCNLAVLLLLIIELAVRCYRKHPKKFFLTSKWGLISFILKYMNCFMHLCIDQMKTALNASTFVHEADVCGSWIVYVITFVYQELPYCCTVDISVLFEAVVWCSHCVK